MKLKCIVVDDEALAREGMERYIAEVDYLELTGSYNSALAAQNALQQQQVDLMILDINMPKLTGLNLLELLPNPPMTILATAYPSFALDGFRLDVMDYLLKPISLERFLKAVQKAKDYYLLNHRQAAEQAPVASGYFFIKQNRMLEKVLLVDILYIEGMQNYVQIYTTTRKMVVHMTFKTLEQSLPSQRFIRIHKSYIVNLDHIEAMGATTVRVGNIELPLARSQRDTLLHRIAPNMLKNSNRL